jgi:Glycosyl hydrolase family 92 N-terminal domain
MTRWVAQTHQNYVSVTPYNWTADTIHGFQGTRQPAIWMGESGPVVIVPGVSRGEELKVKTSFEERGMKMRKETEVITPSYYSIVLDDGHGGDLLVEQSASECFPFPRRELSLYLPTLHSFESRSSALYVRALKSPNGSPIYHPRVFSSFRSDFHSFKHLLSTRDYLDPLAVQHYPYPRDLRLERRATRFHHYSNLYHSQCQRLPGLLLRKI